MRLKDVMRLKNMRRLNVSQLAGRMESSWSGYEHREIK
jgi:hypothetical protein